VDVRSREGDRLGKLKLDEFEKVMINQYPEGIPLPERLYK